MTHKNFAYIWVVVLVIGAVLILVGRNKNGSDTVLDPSLSPTVSVSPGKSPVGNNDSNLGTPSGKDIQSLTPQEIEKLINGGLVATTVPYAQLTKPATCRIEGTIKFVTPTIAENVGAKLVYTGIDSPARQIKWRVSPDQDLKVGPNLTAHLNLPDGEARVDATLPSEPISKNYTLTTSMTYGRWEGQGVVVHEVSCSGQVKVVVDF